MIILEKDLKKIIKNKLLETRFLLSSDYEYYNNKYKKWQLYFTDILPRIILNNTEAIFIDNDQFYLADFKNIDIKKITTDEYESILRSGGLVPIRIYLPTTLFQIYMNNFRTVKESEYLKTGSYRPSDNTKILEIEDLYKIFEKIKLMSSDERIDVNLNASNMSKNIGSQYNFKNFNSIEEMQDYLYDIAGPDIFITFADSYRLDANGNPINPQFNLNPNATFKTPHGFYFYPFDKINAKAFINYGQPTRAEFAVDRNFFHLVKVDLSNKKTIIFEEDGTCNKKISYENYIKNVKELIRVHEEFFKLEINHEETFKKLNLFMEMYHGDYENLNDDDFESGIYLDNNNFVSNLYKFAFFLSFKDFTDINRKYLFDEDDEGNVPELFSLLLYLIGIRCVIDRGLCIIHENEPEQMHIITFGDDTSFYEYIGTFDNWFNAYN